MIFTMPEMDQYQRKHLIHDQIWQLLKICLVPYKSLITDLFCANVHHDIYVRLKSS